MPPTLREIAKRLNVAPSTVSRALADDAGVGESRAAEIRALADKLGYRPRPMRRSVNRTIGLAIATPDARTSDEAWQSLLISAVVNTVGAHGWHVLQEFTARKSADIPKLVRENRVDGMLITGLPSPATCRALRELGMPTVALNDLASRTGLPSVIADGADGTREVVAGLAAMGHRHIALASTPLIFPTVAARARAFREAAKAAGVRATVVVGGGTTIQQGQVATRQLMARRPFPTAIVYSSDRLAVGGLIELGRLGFSVPGDVSVVGHENTGFGRDTDPPLTSVDMHQREMVETAFSLLRAQIENGASADVVQKTAAASVAWRGSTAGVLPSRIKRQSSNSADK